MVTIGEVAAQIISRSPFLEEALSQDLVNISSLARKIKPEIEEELYKEVQLGAVVMALKRIQEQIPYQDNKLGEVLANLGDITVRSGIVEYTFSNSSTLTQKQSNLLNSLSKEKRPFLTITDGVFETSIFASSDLSELIEAVFKDEVFKSRQTNLSSITIIIPEEATYVPGVYYSILKVLAWEGISFVEVVSSFTELTVFLEDKNVDRAFSVLKKFRSKD